MSIEKHMARHAEESGRLHDLTLESKERLKLSFNVEQEIGEEGWTTIKSSLKESQSKEFPMDFDSLVTHAFILFPDRIDELNLDAETWRRVFDHMHSTYPALSSHGGRKIEVSDDTWLSLVSELEDELKRKRWVHCARAAAILKLLQPEAVQQIPAFAIDEERWSEMKQELKDHMRRGFMELFLRQASSMKILAAEKIEMTDHGLKLTMPVEDFTEKRSPRPERRAL